MVGNKKYKTLAEGIKEMKAEQTKDKNLLAQFAKYVSDVYKSTMLQRPSNRNMFELTIITRNEITHFALQCENDVEIYEVSENKKCFKSLGGVFISNNIDILPDTFIGCYKVVRQEHPYVKRLVVMYHKKYTEQLQNINKIKIVDCMSEFTIVRKKELRELTKECEAGIEIYNNSESDKCTFFESGFKFSSDLNKLPNEFIGEYEITDWEGYRAYFKYAKKSPLKFEGKRLLVLYHELYTECQDAFESGFKRVDKYKLKKLDYDNVLIFGIKKGDICIYENADELLSEDLDDLKDFFFGDYKIFNSEDLMKMFGKEYERKGKSLVILFGQGYNFNTGKYLYDEIEHKWGGKREGAGRPEKNRGRMTLWLDEETKSLLEKEAERTKESRSDVINRILKEAIKS